MSEPFPDFPKLYSPLVREAGKIVRPFQVAEGFEWSFEPGIVVYEKTDGTNVGVRFDALGQVERIQNRRNLVWDAGTPKDQELNGWTRRIYEAVMRVYNGQRRGPPGQVVYGEAVGPKLNTNRHGLREAVFSPFTSISLRYNDTFFATPEMLEAFVMNAPPLFCRGYEPEGVVLYGKEPWQMAKVRRDMFV